MARRDGNYSKVFAWRTAIREDKALSAQARCVAFILSTYMDEEGVCWPGQQLIADGCNLSPRMVRRYVFELEEGDWLKVSLTQTSGGRRNTYLATVPWASYLGDA